jgi:hypothetical protein
MSVIVPATLLKGALVEIGKSLVTRISNDEPGYLRSHKTRQESERSDHSEVGCKSDLSVRAEISPGSRCLFKSSDLQGSGRGRTRTTTRGRQVFAPILQKREQGTWVRKRIPTVSAVISFMSFASNPGEDIPDITPNPRTFPRSNLRPIHLRPPYLPTRSSRTHPLLYEPRWRNRKQPCKLKL